jgi:signal transduction histidine kinase
MKISKKVSIILIGVQCVLTGLSIGFSNYSFSNYVNGIEKSNARKIEDRFFAALNAQKTLVINRVNDWSNWDDAYKFIQGKQPDFVEKNINDAYLKIAKLNHIVFFDLTGKLIHASSTFEPFEKWEPTDVDLVSVLTEVAKSNPKQNTSDIIKFKNRLIIWSITPITDSEAKLAPSGYLVMARELDTKNSPDFGDYFGHNYMFEMADQVSISELELHKLAENELDILFPLYDQNKNVLAVTSVHIPRNENLIATKTKYVSLAILLGLVSIGVFATYILIHLLIIRRLSKVTADIPNVLSGQSTLLTYENSEDEISDFSRFFNTSIKLFREQTEKANEAQLALSHSAQLSSIGEIAGSIVHEIKNPLSIITINVSQLKKMIDQQSIDYEKFNSKLLRLESTTKKITNIINTVSRFSRRDTHEYNQKILLKNIFEDALFLMTEKVRKQNVLIKSSFDENTEVCCNPALLALVIGNLMSNSLDAISDIKDPWIELGFRSGKDNYEILITDCGPGLPPEFIERMRQPYFTTKPQGKGTGLGLSFSRKVMADHKGAIDYDSGCANTRFILRFPKIAEVHSPIEQKAC